MTEQEKNRIDGMSQLQLCRLWRFAKCDHPLFQGDTGKYFEKVMKENGGLTTEISKQIGW